MSLAFRKVLTSPKSTVMVPASIPLNLSLKESEKEKKPEELFASYWEKINSSPRAETRRGSYIFNVDYFANSTTVTPSPPSPCLPGLKKSS